MFYFRFISANDCTMLMTELSNREQFAQLLQKISFGDEAAFARLFSIFNKRLIAFAYSIVKNMETAEEVSEDVFVKVWMNRLRLAEIENLSVYLYVAVKNTALNKLSEKARRLTTAPFDDLDPSIVAINQDPYSLFITNEMLQKVNLVINALPPRCKMIFKLIREDGLKYKEVAEILNISVNTIDAQMAIAVKRICEALGISKTRSLAAHKKAY